MFLRNTIVLAGLEATYASAATVTGADAILLSNVSINPLRARNVPRDLVQGYFGGSVQLVGVAYREITATVELAGSGTATTPPKWGRLLQAMGFAQTVGAASVDYTLTSTFGANSSLTMQYYLDGLLHTMVGARGTFSMVLGVGERPALQCRFIGLVGSHSASANPSPDYTAFRSPVAVTDTNTGDLLLGALTYTGATGVISGGTAYVSKGLQLELGNNLVHQPLLGQERALITQREVTGRIALDLTPAQAVAFLTDVQANTLTGCGITHGTVAGNIIGVHMPSIQRIDPAVEDEDGVALSGYSIRAVPVSGNDELRIIAR